MHVGIDVGTNVTAPKILIERLGMELADAGYATSVYFLFRTIGCLSGAFILAKVSGKMFFAISVIMDGIECCRRLKGELQTCHIPIILLTACSLDEQRIEGFENGADSYISKPFNSLVLTTRVRNLIDGHKRMKQFFGDNTSEKEPICDIDKIFIGKFKKLIEEGISNSELNVEDLGKDMVPSTGFEMASYI